MNSKSEPRKPIPIKTILVCWFVFFMLCDFTVGFFVVVLPEGTYHSYFHHTLRKNFRCAAKWGYSSYNFASNSLGFKDSDVREVPLSSDIPRVLFMGDSFTEGVGYSYDKTFVGKAGKHFEGTCDILNAAVKSYSPKLMFLKTQYLLETVGLKFDSLFVFLDISDIQDEVAYHSFEPVLPANISWKPLRQLDSIMYDRSFLYNTFHTRVWKRVLNKIITAEDVPGIECMDRFNLNYYSERARWTSDDHIYSSWGKVGLQLAKDHMTKLVELCREREIGVTLAVYPWRYHIENRELNCVQARSWNEFAKQHHIEFVDFFPDFINDVSYEDSIKRYFIVDDDHWNEAGHALVASKVIASISRAMKSNE
ncbi:MAG: SGNH/GDSL hydrolase family protein [Planctomycetes bacterium]|nr:SGNH/GDSL hydrolase family protein [Planctomycetota bacterium]